MNLLLVWQRFAAMLRSIKTTTHKDKSQKIDKSSNAWEKPKKLKGDIYFGVETKEIFNILYSIFEHFLSLDKWSFCCDMYCMVCLIFFKIHFVQQSVWESHWKTLHDYNSELSCWMSVRKSLELHILIKNIFKFKD